MPANKLTPKQARFVEEYLIDLNATQAATRAGYSKKTAEQSASRLLRNVKVEAAIETAQAARSERTEIDQEWVIARLAKIADVDVVDGTKGHIKAADVNTALEKIGKHLGMFKEKIEISKPLEELTDEQLAKRQAAARAERLAITGGDGL